MYIFPELRKHQKSTLEKIKSSPKKFIILHAPTGSGKSFFPAQLVYEGNRVLSLVATKSLQNQYANYDMSILYGKSNYDCKNQPVMFGDQPTANDCELRCDLCPYPLARAEFLNSYGGVLNYPKFLLDQRLVKEFDPEYLFLDEAHVLSNIVLDYAKSIFHHSRSAQLKKYSPGQFPIGLPQPLAYPQAIEWLNNLLSNMRQAKPLPPKNGGDLSTYRWYKNMTRKVQTTLSFMTQVPEAWHIESDNHNLLIKPKTARFNFIDLFDKADKIILMSATIDKHTLRELGIKDCEWIEVPNLWPPPLRPVVDLKCPRMKFGSSDEDKDLQARIIASALSECPPEHTGPIHVTSKSMAHNLAFRLGKLTKRRIFVPDENDSTEEVYEQWMQIKNDGTIMPYWGAWEGWDLGKDHINIMGKVPFPPIKFRRDKETKKSLPIGYDTHRYIYDTNASKSRTAAKAEQCFGRIRRGNLEDYGDAKFVAIADGNWTRVQKYFNDVLIV